MKEGCGYSGEYAVWQVENTCLYIDAGQEESFMDKKCVSGLKLVKTSCWMELKDFTGQNVSLQHLMY